MSDAISSLGRYMESLGQMQAGNLQVQQLTQELNTGTKSVSLAGYGSSATTILNLQDMVQETQTWISNSTSINTTLQAYGNSLGQLTTDATTLQNTLSAMANPPTAEQLSNLKTLVTGLEADVGATLNSQVGDTYIFAGTRYSTAPVVDLTQLAVPTTPAAITLASGSATPPTIPNYDTAYAGTSPPGQVTTGTPYYAQQQANIAVGVTLTYGVTSNDPSIQQLVYALGQAAGAVASTTTANTTQFIANAQSALSTALSGLATLTDQNDQNQVTIKNEQAVQNQAIATMQSQLGDLTQVDTATVATQLTAVENQLNATYKATSTLLNLSLLTYLGS